jgi:hypothetical protein
MKKLTLKYPWKQLERGQGFFIPCLNPEETRREGLIQAQHAHVFDARAYVGIRNGRLGVLFKRLSS